MEIGLPIVDRETGDPRRGRLVLLFAACWLAAGAYFLWLQVTSPGGAWAAVAACGVVGLSAVYLGLTDFVHLKSVEIDATKVVRTRRDLLGTHRWEAPLAEYAGLQVTRGRGPKRAWHVVLRNPRRNRSVRLWSSDVEAHSRMAAAEYAKLLGRPLIS